MRKGSTEFSNFKRVMAKMEATKKKEEAILKASRGKGKKKVSE